MVWRNTTKWLPDVKHQQEDTIFSVWSPVQMRNRANRTRVNRDPTVVVVVVVTMKTTNDNYYCSSSSNNMK